MSQDWIINVLEDLRKFAAQNGFLDLAEQLDDAIHVAVAETTAKARHSVATEPYARSNGSVPRARGAL
jgi:hypothetical protein